MIDATIEGIGIMGLISLTREKKDKAEGALSLASVIFKRPIHIHPCSF